MHQWSRLHRQQLQQQQQRQQQLQFSQGEILFTATENTKRAALRPWDGVATGAG